MPLQPGAGGEEMANQMLAGHLGPDRSTVAPDTYQIEAWIDDPRSIGATQADFGGYTPNVWDSDDWDTADGRTVSTIGLVDMGTPSSAGSDAIRFWALRNVTSGLLAFSAKLERPVYVSISTDPVLIRPTVQFA